MPSTIDDIQNFLKLRRIALVGCSRDPKDFSRYVFHEMCKEGYDMVPVNPAMKEVESKRCFGHVGEIDPPVEGALLMTSSKETGRVVKECADAGIRSIWMHRSGGQGAVNDEAVTFCHDEGMHLVEGYCPFMFLPNTAFFHRVHGFLLKLTGGYPGKGSRVAH